MKERKLRRKEQENFHSAGSVHKWPQGANWARLKPENSSGCFTWVAGTQPLEQSSVAFPRY